MSSADIANELANFDKTAKNPLDIYNEALSSLGISDARTRVTNLRGELLNTENALNAVEGDVTARTSEGMVSEAQRRSLVSVNQAPISAKLGVIGKNYDSAQQSVNDITREGTTKADLLYKGQQDSRSSIVTRYDMALKGEQEAEQKRQFEETQRLQREQLAASERSSVRSSGGSGGSSQPSNQELFASALAAKTGKDGKVSPGTYNSLKKQWVSAGYGDYKSFHDRFWKFANQAHWWDYYYG